MARPTKYNKEILAKAKEYLEIWPKLGDAIPLVAGLASHCDVSKRVIYDWAKDEDKLEFLHTLDKLQEKQERILITKGLTGDFNAAITKLALHNHDYSEKSEQTIQGGANPVKIAAWEVLPVAGSEKPTDD